MPPRLPSILFRSSAWRLVGGLALFALPLCLYACESRTSAARHAMVVYCAAGLKGAVEAASAQYEQKTGTQIQLQYGGSGQLLSAIEVTRTGDVFIPADESYVRAARERKLIAESAAVARQRPVIAVRAGNPKRIRSIADLSRADVRVALANPETASIGRVTKRILSEAGQWEGIAKNAAVMKPTVSDVANDVQLGTVDAAVVWDATVSQLGGIDAVTTPELSAHTEEVLACVLSSAGTPAEALRFITYLAAPALGGSEFAKRGYAPAEAK